MQELIFTKEFQIDATKADRWGRLAPMALLECMQAASTDHAELLGVGREALLRHDLFWAVARQQVEILRLPVIGETLTIETWPGEASRAAHPRFLVGRCGEETVFRGAAMWLFMNVNTREMILPQASGLRLNGITRGGEIALPRSIAPRLYANETRRTVRYSELDCNGHLNNARYLSWAEDLLPSAWHREHVPSMLRICYLNEALEGQEIVLHWALEDDALHLEANAGHRVFALQVNYHRAEDRK